MNWLNDAACRPGQHVNPQWFDDRSDENESPYQRGVRHGRAIQVCMSCPVVLNCYATAVDGDGIRGGQLQPEAN